MTDLPQKRTQVGLDIKAGLREATAHRPPPRRTGPGDAPCRRDARRPRQEDPKVWSQGYLSVPAPSRIQAPTVEGWEQGRT